MQDQKQNTSTSNSKIKIFSLEVFLFSLPVIVIYLIVEILIGHIDNHEIRVQNYFENEKDEIEIVLLGSSQTQRAINPKYLSNPALNLANSSQTIYEDFQLLKHFAPQLPKLKLVVIELFYDILERDKSNVSPSLDNFNLKFYGVNTFGRDLKLQDYFLFHTNPDYFSERISNYFLNKSPIKLNKYGFDENKFDGAYSHADYVLIENVKNEENFKRNFQYLHQMIEYCRNNNLQVMIYQSPTHKKFNELRDPDLVKKWHEILDNLKIKYSLQLFIDDKNNFERKYFDDASHLNPNGAEKETKILDSVILNLYKNDFSLIKK